MCKLKDIDPWTMGKKHMLDGGADESTNTCNDSLHVACGRKLKLPTTRRIFSIHDMSGLSISMERRPLFLDFGTLLRERLMHHLGHEMNVVNGKDAGRGSRTKLTHVLE
jgi:hypothetical protein